MLVGGLVGCFLSPIGLKNQPRASNNNRGHGEAEGASRWDRELPLFLDLTPHTVILCSEILKSFALPSFFSHLRCQQPWSQSQGAPRRNGYPVLQPRLRPQLAKYAHQPEVLLLDAPRLLAAAPAHPSLLEYQCASARLATGNPPPPEDTYLDGFLPRSIHIHREKTCAAVSATWMTEYLSLYPAYDELYSDHRDPHRLLPRLPYSCCRRGNNDDVDDFLPAGLSWTAQPPILSTKDAAPLSFPCIRIASRSSVLSGGKRQDEVYTFALGGEGEYKQYLVLQLQLEHSSTPTSRLGRTRSGAAAPASS